MKRAPAAVFASLLPILAALLPARPADACAPAPPPGAFVQIAEESAIIVWDEKARVEHFIRRASFRTTARDFGFLVPTPGKPELAEMDDSVFDRLEQATRPEVIHESKLSGVEPTLLCGFMFFLSRGSAPSEEAPASVRVLDARRIAGYDAVVLEADDARDLARWLKEHGYAERPALADWLTPYVVMRWKLTAFKIAPKEEGQAVATSAVRMTFSTEQPIFPYREPSDQRENLPANLPEAHRERLLRIFFFGPDRVAGALGGRGQGGTWPGKAIWSNHLDPAKSVALPGPIPAGAWLTVFEDKASPRPGIEDLFFARAADQRPIVPPPVVLTTKHRLPLPLDVIGGVGLGVWLLWRKAKRAKRAGERAS